MICAGGQHSPVVKADSTHSGNLGSITYVQVKDPLGLVCVSLLDMLGKLYKMPTSAYILLL